MKQESTVDLLLDVNQRPSAGKGILLSFQHVFAMFGATILVPLILGMPVSVALFASGVGTLIYMISTGFKVPVYLGSSFAFITAMSLAMKELGGDVSAAQTGVILTGFIYVLVAAGVRFAGTKWIDKLLPPIIIGPMIIVIGLGLAGSAVTNAGLVADGNWKNALVAVVTFLIAAFINTKGKGFLRIIPFLFAIIGGYLFALTLGLVDFTPVLKANWFEIPGFYLPFSTGGAFKEYNLYFGPETIAILPIAIVTISEHIGDHTVLGQICGRQFLKEPGLHRTLLGDGIATSVSAFLGGPANTTYGENTGVLAVTKVYDPAILRIAACFAIVLGLIGKFGVILQTIPQPVMGGVSIILFGMIAAVGVRTIVEAQLDFTHSRNLIIAALIFVLGIAIGDITIWGTISVSGLALAALVGIVLNKVLPEDK